ncbi:MAG: hypothetical protein JWQ35_296 [Bacteriovoracaceae bacterium]|nr:hypothetical protein [Bacteriovoracaceae bacterium]
MTKLTKFTLIFLTSFAAFTSAVIHDIKATSCSDYLHLLSNPSLRISATLSPEIQKVFEEYIEDVKKELTLHQQKFLLNAISNIQKIKFDLKKSEAAHVTQLTRQIKLSEPFDNTDLGIILLVHEISHLKDLLVQGRLNMTVKKWFFFHKDQLLENERRAFSAEYDFIRKVFTKDDIEILDTYWKQRMERENISVIDLLDKNDWDFSYSAILQNKISSALKSSKNQYVEANAQRYQSKQAQIKIYGAVILVGVPVVGFNLYKLLSHFF